jgi:hypothetical protein
MSGGRRGAQFAAPLFDRGGEQGVFRLLGREGRVPAARQVNPAPDEHERADGRRQGAGIVEPVVARAANHALPLHGDRELFPDGAVLQVGDARQEVEAAFFAEVHSALERRRMQDRVGIRQQQPLRPRVAPLHAVPDGVGLAQPVGLDRWVVHDLQMRELLLDPIENGARAVGRMVVDGEHLDLGVVQERQGTRSGFHRPLFVSTGGDDRDLGPGVPFR